MKKLLAMFCAVLIVLCTGLPAVATEDKLDMGGEATITFETNERTGQRECTYTYPNGGELTLGERAETFLTPEGVLDRAEIADYWTLYESKNLRGGCGDTSLH